MTDYSIEDLERLWNEQDDPLNTWDELGLDEIVAFAQQVARQTEPTTPCKKLWTTHWRSARKTKRQAMAYTNIAAKK